MKRTDGCLRSLLELFLLGALLTAMILLFRAVSGPKPAAPPAEPAQATLPYPPPFEGTPYPTADLEPSPTLQPTETLPPPPTLIPTPIVTAFPTSPPPILPFPPEKKPEPFTLLYREKNSIQAIDSDGSNPRLFSDVHTETSWYLGSEPACGVEKWVEPAPDGKAVALVLCDTDNLMSLPKGQFPRYQIYLLDLATLHLRLLVEDGVEPVWSPDGRKIAYRNANSGLSVFDLEKGETKEVYKVDMYKSHWAMWFDRAPDSEQIVFVHEVDQVSRAIIALNIHHPETFQILVPASNAWPSVPKWSPQGDKILFMSQAGKGSIEYDHLFNLWTMNPDGSELLQITQDMNISSPMWSPDGAWIAFSGLPVYEPPPAYYDLWVISRSGKELKRLTSASLEQENLLLRYWSPDGAQLIYEKEKDQVFVFSLLEGKTSPPLPIPGDYVVLPTRLQ